MCGTLVVAFSRLQTQLAFEGNYFRHNQIFRNKLIARQNLSFFVPRSLFAKNGLAFSARQSAPRPFLFGYQYSYADSRSPKLYFLRSSENKL